MKAGSLYEAVAFDAPTVSADGSGGQETSWTEQFTTRAHFRYLRGGEVVQAARLQGRQPVVVTVRSNSETEQITTDWRMRDTRRQVSDGLGGYKRGVYNIRTVVPSDDRKWIEITAETGVAT